MPMFKLLYPPKPLTRRRVPRELVLMHTEKGSISLAEVKEAIDKVAGEGACLKQAKLTHQYARTHISYHADESEEEYDRRVKQQNINMVEFERWKEKYAVEIAEAVEKKKKAALEKAEKDRKEIEYLEQLYSS